MYHCFKIYSIHLRPKHTLDGYKPKKIAGAFGENYIELESEAVKIVPMGHYIENVGSYLGAMIRNF